MERRNAQASPIIISVSHSRSNSAQSISGQRLPLDNDMQRPRFLKVEQVRFGSGRCENSDVELTRRKFASITLNNKRTALAVTVERRKERKQFCAFFARARFHTARTQTGNRAQSEPKPRKCEIDA